MEEFLQERENNMPADSLYPPIQLPLNMWLGALTCLINYTQVAMTNNAGFDIPLLNETQDSNVPLGNGKLILSADIPEVKEYSQVSSLLNVVNPIVAEQYIELKNFKTIPLTINNYLMRLSFTQETDSANFGGYILSLMQVSKNINMYEQMVNLYQLWTPTPFDDSKPIGTGKRGQKESTVEIELFDVSKLTDPNAVNTISTFNSNKIYNTILNYVARLNSPTTLYNEQGMKEFIKKNEIRMTINSSFENQILINTLATLFNSPNITASDNYVSRYITIPDTMLTESNRTTIIGWLGHYKKFQWGYFYNLATSFFDGSNLMLNNWLQYSYYMNSIDNYPMLILKAKLIDPPTPTPPPTGE